jgi:16S rRNA (guanine966-N2)-methyltransferase
VARAAPPPGKVRIIGGRWRGRRLRVRDARELRPSPDRVRVTLFNWLDRYIEGASCLDLFAGTGVLGFEALSRGARRAVLVESSRALCEQLREDAARLEASGAHIACMDAFAWLNANRESFDIVFLDPPFGTDLAAQSCAQILNSGHLARGGLIYVESGAGFRPPEPLEIRKQGRAGRVHYMLLARAGE